MHPRAHRSASGPDKLVYNNSGDTYYGLPTNVPYLSLVSLGLASIIGSSS